MTFGKRETNQRFPDVRQLFFRFGVATIFDLGSKRYHQAAQQQGNDDDDHCQFDQRKAAYVP